MFYLLDPAGAVQQLFLIPEFAAARGIARTAKPGTWEASPHYKRLDAATGGDLSRQANSAWELGADGVQLTLSRKDTTSVFLLRSVTAAARAHILRALGLLSSVRIPSCMRAQCVSVGR